MKTDRIGFIGLGNMGGRMTRRLVDAGIAVLGYDTRAGRAPAAGAQAARSVGVATDYAVRVMLSLRTHPSSRRSFWARMGCWHIPAPARW